ncbi:MAG: hypothetical protein ACRC2T_17780 [Thermoguttaceae bacterium]
MSAPEVNGNASENINGDWAVSEEWGEAAQSEEYKALSSPTNSQNQKRVKKSPEEEVDEIIGSIHVPEGIDPVLLSLWLKRERTSLLRKIEEKLEKKNPKAVIKHQESPKKQSLSVIYASFVTISVMIVVILLGLINRDAPILILRKIAVAMPGFCVIGFIFGIITEKCVNQSAKQLVEEVVKRSDEYKQQEVVEENFYNDQQQ